LTICSPRLKIASGNFMKLAISVAAALLLAPAAHAQASCDQVNQLLTTASDGFSAVRGEDIGDELYRGTLTPTGIDACTIRIDVDDTYRCGGAKASQALLASAYEKQVDILRACLSGWMVSTHRFGDDAPAAPTIALDGVRLNEPGAVRGMSTRFQRTVRGDILLVFVGRNEIVENGGFDFRLTIVKEGR
jgi:hypothetical protein